MLIFAYVDPGSGTLLWQLLVSAIFGGLFFIRQARETLKRKISAILTKLRNK